MSSAVIIANGYLDKVNGKTAHGLVRGSERFNIVAVIDPEHEGKDAGDVVDGKKANIPVFSSLEQILSDKKIISKPEYIIVGVAFPGGGLPTDIKATLLKAIENGISVVNGSHKYLSDDTFFVEKAIESGVEIIDVRKPKNSSNLHFWTGDIFKVKAKKVALLGMDCACGKRTTGRFLLESLKNMGKKAEMIYTGQTGWLQGYKYGFIFDSTINDFVSGELENAIVRCDKEESPDIILVEGQSSLQNPSGPCGSEYLLSANVKHVVYQYTPFRKFFDGMENIKAELPKIEDEFKLIEIYGAKVIAITLNTLNGDNNSINLIKSELQEKYNIPVVAPFIDGVQEVASAITSF